MRPDHLGLNKISAASASMDTAALYQKGLANVTAQITAAYSANKELMAKAVRLQAANWRSQATINRAAISQAAIVQSASRNMQTALSQAVKIDMRLASPAQQYQNIMRSILDSTAESREMRSRLFSPHLVEILDENIADEADQPIDIASDFFNREDKGSNDQTKAPKRVPGRDRNIEAQNSNRLPASHKDNLSNENPEEDRRAFSQEQYYQFFQDYIPNLILFLAAMPNGYGVAISVLVTIYKIAIDAYRPK
ncbi:hypothetical protein [Lacticaseibacillus mingshuiensis]|uniref:hypothetical protein n=1 Tax=Lacticaseibacillus mingshuiensis TaxID=2799574 RepID=UPI0019529D78|nr:hypothetical protein [Lacticaseibacillus mingshuiensis]